MERRGASLAKSRPARFSLPTQSLFFLSAARGHELVGVAAEAAKHMPPRIDITACECLWSQPRSSSSKAPPPAIYTKVFTAGLSWMLHLHWRRHHHAHGSLHSMLLWLLLEQAWTMLPGRWHERHAG